MFIILKLYIYNCYLLQFCALTCLQLFPLIKNTRIYEYT